MANYDNTNRGVLFKNDKDGNEKRPDYTGSLNVGGTEYQLSAWIKDSKAGTKYMSLSVQPKREQQASPGVNARVQAGADFDDSVPF